MKRFVTLRRTQLALLALGVLTASVLMALWSRYKAKPDAARVGFVTNCSCVVVSPYSSVADSP